MKVAAMIMAFGVLISNEFIKVMGVLHGATKEDLDRLFSEYEIVRPTVVDVRGEFISHDVRNAFEKTHLHYLKRSRRSLRSDDVPVTSDDPDDQQLSRSIDVRNDMYFDVPSDVETSDDRTNLTVLQRAESGESRHDSPRSATNRYLHFNVTAFGRRMQLRVQMKAKLIAPGAKSVRFTSDGRRIEKDLNQGCYYHGSVPRHTRSKVAISNCEGLAGLIKTDSDELYIEPLEDQNSEEAPQHHVVYRRRKWSGPISFQTREERIRTHADTSTGGEFLANSVDMLMENHADPIRRGKRHAKRRDYNVETLLAADSEVVNFHGSNRVDNYLLTLINIVDEIYHDSTLGEHVNIVLTKIYQLDEERSRALITNNNPALSLKNVCKWAYSIHQTDPPPHGRRPDHSVFLTRRRFGPAGYAHVAGMCRALRSCSLNFEDGFSSAFVVAHETGHVLGMEHDGEGNNCGDETSMGSVMSPVVQAAFHRFHWSRCSQQELRSHLRNFKCLRDDPHETNWGPTPVYPGMIYTVDDQCRFDFGRGYKRCTAFRNMDVCDTLWCSHHDNPTFCKTKKGPPVDGTMCGDNMWCFKSRCVWRDERYRPVDGSWSTWSAFGECSRSCGTGARRRRRTCSDPPPQYSGSPCVGSADDYELCSKRPCSNARDYRAEQCAYHNNRVEYENQRHKWLPYEPLNAELKCELFCVSKKTSDVVTMDKFVVDGTRCSYDDAHGICINGECANIGCDRVLGSSLREDDCGVCGGNGSECHNISRRVNKRSGRKLNGYTKLLKIPADSRNIRVAEVSSNDNSNMLAIKSRADRRYVLNAKGKVISEDMTPYQYVNVGTLWTYDSRDGVETITSRGPTLSNVVLLVLVKQRNVRVSVDYSYTTRSAGGSVSRDSYQYEIKRWTPCSVTCGRGFRRGKYGCRRRRKQKWVKHKFCRGRPPRPIRERCEVECNTTARWVTGKWGACSKSCGVDGIQTRPVKCKRRDGGRKSSGERACASEEKPQARQVCHPPPCPAQWRTGPWTQCSASCGGGTQRRHVVCRARRRPANPEECSPDERPPNTQRCATTLCSDDAASTAAPSTPSTDPSLSASNNNQSNSSENDLEDCREDGAEFCNAKAMAQYCSLPDYRRICCVSCGALLNIRQSRDPNPSSLAAFSAAHSTVTNLTNQHRDRRLNEQNEEHDGFLESTIDQVQNSSSDLENREEIENDNNANRTDGNSSVDNFPALHTDRNESAVKEGLSISFDPNPRNKRSADLSPMFLGNRKKCRVLHCGIVRMSTVNGNIGDSRQEVQGDVHKIGFVKKSVCRFHCFSLHDPQSKNIWFRPKKECRLLEVSLRRVDSRLCNSAVYHKVAEKTFKNSVYSLDENFDFRASSGASGG